MTAVSVRPAEAKDREAIRTVEERAFGGRTEADLVERLVSDGAVVLELVAEIDGRIAGHVVFSRLTIESDGGPYLAVALAPLAIAPDFQGRGVGTALVEDGHRRLEKVGETLSVVLGDPEYYNRFGYSHDRAEQFLSDYQGEALQALAWGEAPSTGRLVYAAPFAAL
ncbi:N-acetyltransferase [Pseudaminobacter sp. 19-2017]|uniref:N-acetyltransferase n=1 Tax=Pseudaminobacter soli (ex Zhang et al. 2022) TaxID=2831468 RepID=A0A942E138_9HYPH|nr:N-acetyltransferase [Pseudaminobacter soli]MBS3648675.1 N-acetyltransferase [Pseudaminobacter soli]